MIPGATEAGGEPRARTDAGEAAEIGTGTVVDLFLRGAREYPREDSVWVRRPSGEWEGLSRPLLEERVLRISLGLRSLGLERGDRVAIASRTRLEWALADYALVMAGLVSVPVYPSLPPEQAGYVLANSEARAAFVEDGRQLGKLARVRDDVPELERAFLFEAEDRPEGEPPLPLMHLGELEEAGRAAEADLESPEEFARRTEPSDLATLIYTSGTTGRPKGVMLTHGNFYANVVQSQRVLAMSPEDRSLSWLPLSHVFERTAGHYLLWCSGVTIAYAESRETVARDLREVGPTLMTAVPRFYEKVYETAAAAAESGGRLPGALFRWAEDVGRRRVQAEQDGREPGAWLRLQGKLADLLVFRRIRQRTGGNLRYLVSGGAPLPVPTGEFFHAAGLPVLEGYGLTEASPVVAVNPPDRVKLGTVGPPIPGTEVKVAEDGELLVRGPQVMEGYYRKEEATREVLTDDGWLRTGDVGELDEDGYLMITDRKKQIIVTSYGKNIAPQPVENAIRQSRYVDQAVLVGDRRKFPLVLVVPEEEALREWAGDRGVDVGGREEWADSPEVRELLEEEVRERTAEFADHERPKEVVVIPGPFTVDDGQLTPTLKVKRRVVTDQYEEEIEAAYRRAIEEHDRETGRDR